MKSTIGWVFLALVVATTWMGSTAVLDMDTAVKLVPPLFSDLGVWKLVALALVIAASGFVSGLSGFGFSAIGALTLWILPPVKAIPLLMALSTVNQMTSMHGLMRSFNARDLRSSSGPMPYVIGGVMGVPAGLWVLSSLDAAMVCALIGAVLVGYSMWSILKPARMLCVTPTPVRSVIVGALGGVIGGFTAFPGCALVIWAGLVGMGKTEQRTTVQPYILAMQVISLLGLVASGPERFGVEFWFMFAPLVAIALPFTKLGLAAFHRLSEANFKQATHGLLSVSGIALLAKAAPLLAKMATKAQTMLLASVL
jgi:uncharacterized protein